MKEKTKKNIVKWWWIVVCSCMAFVILLVIGVGLFARIPSFEELENPESKEATLLLAEDGEVLSTYHIENRSYVSYEDLSPYVVEAAVATEDVRFYEHSGIDFRSLARVGVKTLLLGQSSQGGGSTITQQLAKTLYPRENLGKRIPVVWQMKMVVTKMKEWITAVKLERNYTKEEIMDMYMNAVFFGSSAYGKLKISIFGLNATDTIQTSGKITASETSIRTACVSTSCHAGLRTAMLSFIIHHPLAA